MLVLCAENIILNTYIGLHPDVVGDRLEHNDVVPQCVYLKILIRDDLHYY